MRTLGNGLTSNVYLAEHMKTKTKVALKQFKEDYLRASEESRIQYLNEVQALNMLSHDNIVKFIEYGINGVMRYPYGISVVSHSNVFIL